MNLSNENEFVFLPDAKEKIGRVVKNAFGEDEVVYAERCHWRYLDWLAENMGMDVEGFIQDCDMARGDCSFSETLAGFGNSRTGISVIPGQFRECSDTVDHRLRCHGILPVLNKAGRDHAETEASEAHDCARHTIHTATDA